VGGNKMVKHDITILKQIKLKKKKKELKKDLGVNIEIIKARYYIINILRSFNKKEVKTIINVNVLM
jgi:hypothetical protein